MKEVMKPTPVSLPGPVGGLTLGGLHTSALLRSGGPHPPAVRYRLSYLVTSLPVSLRAVKQTRDQRCKCALQKGEVVWGS